MPFTKWETSADGDQDASATCDQSALQVLGLNIWTYSCRTCLQYILCVGTEDFKFISKTMARDVRAKFRNDQVFTRLPYMADWILLYTFQETARNEG
jgi:hypothetical protein